MCSATQRAVFFYHGIPMDGYTDAPTNNQDVVSPLSRAEGVKNLPRVLLEEIQAFFQRHVLHAQRASLRYFKLPPLNSRQFNELCADLYRELDRRGKNALNRGGRELSHCVAISDDFSSKRSLAIQRLTTLPTDLFSDLIKDIYFELRSRSPLLRPQNERYTPLFTLAQTTQPHLVFDGSGQELDSPVSPVGLTPRAIYDRSAPFSKHSKLCLDGQITHRSTYPVASGGHADVWTGTLGGQMVAIKIMRPFSSIGRRIQKTKLLTRLWREYLAWSCLSHPNILQCLGFSYGFTPDSEHDVPSLISHWMPNGTILEYIENNPRVDRLKLLVGIATGLSYLHTRVPAIVHGDLRAGNILVSDAGDPCLTDFGLSRILTDTGVMTSSSEFAGSLRWMSPELLHDESPKPNERSDVWAYGMTVLEILTGKRPYSEVRAEPVVLTQIMDGRLPSRPNHNSSVSTLQDQVWGICGKCWRPQPEERPSMHEVTLELTNKPVS